MPSIDVAHRRMDARLFAGALLATCGLQLVELLLPRIPLLPWLRPGFSWIVILPFLLDFGVGPALALFLCRNLLSMAYGGQPASTFLISSASGMAAILALGHLLRLLEAKRWLARAGASVMLAAAFNTLQLSLVAWVLVGSEGYFRQIGPLMLWSVLSGLLVGWLSLPLGDGKGWDLLRALAPGEGAASLPTGHVGASLVAGLLMAASLLVSDVRILGALLAVSVAWGGRGVLRVLARTWPFLPYLAWFHLRDTPGDLVWGSWITRQGVEQLLLQTLRLWAFTAYGRILAQCVPWGRLVSVDAAWARGFALSLQRMPRLFPASLGAARAWWKSKRQGGLEGYLAEMSRKLSDRGPSEA
ncbi:MAG: Gx transporter family protein [Fibrobacterota bacterium]|nr:MAG: Gx transporter family protein [Fibrobacterota bacterium]